MSNSSSAAVGCFPTADAAFGPVVQSCRHDFDFTIAFEQYFFTILPASLLLLAAPLRIGYLRKLPKAVTGHKVQAVTKLTVTVAFALLQLTLILLWATQSEALGRLRTVCVAASCVSFVASVMFCALSYTEHVRCLRPSPILNAYLFVSLILDAVILRTFWLATSLATPIRAIFSASFVLKAALLVLEAIEKESRRKASDGEPGNPESTAGIYSQGLFWWLNPLLLSGFSRLLKPADLYSLDDSMSTASLNEKFWHTWNHAKSKNLLWISVWTLRWRFAMVVFPRLCLLAFTICQPLVLNRFLSFLASSSDSPDTGYGLIGAYGLVYLGIAISTSFYYHRAFRAVTMLRGMLMSAVFAKSTEIVISSDNSAAVTLMSTDVDSIIRAFRGVHEFWANIIQVGLAAWLLSSQIGFAAVGPIVVCAIALTLTMIVSPRANGAMVAWVGKVQKRIGITSTMLGHMKSVKMSGLSQVLSDAIAKLRAEEIDAATPFRSIGALSAALAQLPVLISPVAAFALFTLIASKSGQSLDATRMFSSVSLIILLGQPLFLMFESIIDMNAALGCFKRIEKYLCSPARFDYRAGRETVPAGNNGERPHSGSPLNPSLGIEMQSLGGRNGNNGLRNKPAIDVQDASFSWSAEGRPVLERTTFRVEQGQLTMLVGPVASGKTTLLKGLLGEVPEVTGRVAVLPLRLSWCDQTPWLINDTVRKNIIGFSDFEPLFYNQVITACDLDKDLLQLSNGDETIVGSKGIALSGGQKQRIAIARAVYARPQIAFFDDVLSALDTKTARAVFHRLFSREAGLFHKWGTTVVLATQAVRFLPASDLVLALDKDRGLIEKGVFSRLVEDGGYVKELYGEHRDDFKDAEESAAGQENEAAKVAAAPKAGKSLEEDMRRQQGDVTVYRYFFANVGLSTTLTLLCIEVWCSFLTTFPTVWLKWWSDANAEHPNERTGFFLGIYAGLQVTTIISFFAMTFYGVVVVAARSGINLHRKLLSTVMLAPLSLFTTTDIGSMTTRFSQDIGLLDRNLPIALFVTISNFLNVIGTAALIAAATGFVALSFPFIVAVFYLVQKAYLRTSRQLRFLDLEEKAPVYTQFLETLGGLATIRAFAWEGRALELNHGLVDRAQRPFYLLLMIQQWLTIVLDLVTAGLAVLIVGIAVRLRDSVSVGLTGVSLVQLITLAETVKLLIQFWTSLETSIGAVARIKNFSEETPDENLPGERYEPPPSWPNRGEIRIDGISVSYGENLAHKALQDISLSISPGEKIGICGRTGSGKSTLFFTLLRLLDLTTGTLAIDGLDASTIRRETLRGRLIAITQDGLALPGTVRHNLDPHGGADAVEAEAALHRVGLGDALRLDDAFDAAALSHGQRQLFELARAILRKGRGKVVLLDEATSSVDDRTDALMQAIIREEFAQHTVLSIAHRLETVADFDRVLVLDKGCIVEVGPPAELLRKEGGWFRAMYEGGGRGRAGEVREE